MKVFFATMGALFDVQTCFIIYKIYDLANTPDRPALYSV